MEVRGVPADGSADDSGSKEGEDSDEEKTEGTYYLAS